MLLRLYDRLVLHRPRAVVGVLLCIFAALGYQARCFRLDASADSLILQQDKDLIYFRKMQSRYHTHKFLLMAYSPKADLLSDEALSELKKLRDELRRLRRVSSVVTILDAPLLRCPPVPLKELKRHVTTLESPSVDRALAKAELQESPIYRKLLVSPDMRTTGIVINLARDEAFERLRARRNQLLNKESLRPLTSTEREELRTITATYRSLRRQMVDRRHEDIAAVRAIMDKHRTSGELHLGGVPMVADDMISFIRSDLKVFGVGIFCFLVVALGVVFKAVRWVVLPMLCCACSVLSMVGLLGMLGWEVTVISSNFISLQLVVTMALAIHLVVRYRELLASRPELDNRALVFETVRSMAQPCLYTTATTIAGFGSLLACNILPVIDFGWMMTAGLIVSLVVTFLLFPACLMCLPKPKPRSEKAAGRSMTAFLARVTKSHGRPIIAISLAILVLTTVGISRLTVENSFINYFKTSTEIYKGMRLIDEKLGGTTPLDVILDFEPATETKQGEAQKPAAGDDFSDFSDFDEFDKTDKPDRYWFTCTRLGQVLKVHDYLDSLPQTGKVLSLGTVVKLVAQLTDIKQLDSFDFALLFNELPDQVKKIIVSPYVSIEDDQTRVDVRVIDSQRSLRRNAFLTKVRSDLVTKLGLTEDRVHLVGMMVLYNNMLQSLFRSQIKTVGYTLLAILLMFLVLFRSLKLSLIAIFPNILSCLVVLGVMGLLGIPLDMMTITIVAISVGMAVDNTIHYIHRFRYEFPKDRHYVNTMFRCHGSIGNALYYTTISVIVGFSILALSNFVPCVLFGLFTALAMAMALLAALTLLPALIVLLKPFGPGA